MIKSAALISLILAALQPHPVQAANEVATAEAVARSFLTAVYQNDGDSAASYVVDASELGRFIGQETLDTEAVEAVRRDIEELDIGLALGYEILAAAQDGSALPIGAPLRFTLAYRGTPMAVSTAKTEGGWRVDLRWWIAMIRLSEGRSLAEDHPEILVRHYLIALMKRDTEELQRLVPKDYPIGDLYREGYKPPFEDQYYYLVMEMPLVEAQTGELIPTREGNLAPALAPNSQDKFFIGLYWDTELYFRLIPDGNTYRVQPGDHLARIGL